MNRRRVVAALAAGLSGGCLQLANGDDNTPTRTETNSPTQTGTPTDSPIPTDTPTDSPTPTESPTPTDSPTPTERPEATLPAGLDENGVQRDLLYSFHLSALQSRGFHAEWTKVDRTNESVEWQKEYDSGINRAIGRATARGDGAGPADIYRTGSRGLWREQIGGGAYTYGQDDMGWEIEPITFGAEVSPLVEIGDWGAPTRINDDRPAVWELDVDGVVTETPTPGPSFGERSPVSELSGTMQVDERGVIRSITVSYNVDPFYSSGSVQYTTRFQVDQVGRITVTKPPWLTRAVARRPRVEVTRASDGQYVAFEHREGSPLEPGTKVSVYDEETDATRTGDLTERLTSGETVYLWKIGEEGRGNTELRVTREQPTGVARRFTGEIDAWARRANLEYFKADDVS